MTANQQTGSGRVGLVAASIIVSVALVLCTLIGARTLVRVKSLGQSIRVTGAAYQPIRSDFAIWDAYITANAPTTEAAYAELKQSRGVVQGFLSGAGFGDDEYEMGTVDIRREFNRDGDLRGYYLRQRVTLELKDVERIRRLSQDASNLIEQGVMIESHSPRYLFTGLDTLKIDMIRQATENAKLRAQQLAESTGRKVGPPVEANIGVFQIRALHSQEVSGMGLSDVSSIEKEIVSTVHVSFLID